MTVPITLEDLARQALTVTATPSIAWCTRCSGNLYALCPTANER